jgi:hypothetical protein
MPIEMITEDTELTRAGFHWRERDGVRALCSAQLEKDGFTNAFSTRLGGVSPMPNGDLNLAGFNEDAAENIHENRRRFLRLFDNNWMLTGCWQQHTADVRVVTDAEDARRDQELCDALITTTPRVLLAVKTADCVPILLGDAKTGAVASIHAGWRGTIDSIVVATINRIRNEFGTNPNDLRAAIGPAALACCYEVGEEVIEGFRSRFENAESLFTPTREGHARVDLHRANHDQLIACGVSSDRIHTASLCTMCRTDLFFSFRKEKRVYGKTGRLMSVIGVRD